MDKKGFKIGDKIVLKNPKDWRQGKNIGTLVQFPYGNIPYFKVVWDKNDFSYYYSDEIKRVNRKGEQLVFSFMRIGD